MATIGEQLKAARLQREASGQLTNLKKLVPPVPVPVPPPPPPPTPAKGVTVSSGETGGLDEEKYGKFIKMRKLNLPEGAIRQKMLIDGLSAAEQDSFFNDGGINSNTAPSTSVAPPKPPGIVKPPVAPAAPPKPPTPPTLPKLVSSAPPPAPPKPPMPVPPPVSKLPERLPTPAVEVKPAIQIPPMVPSSNTIPLSTGGSSDKFAKYASMLKMNVPERSVRQKMSADGFDAQEIDTFVASQSPVISQPNTARSVSVPINANETNGGTSSNSTSPRVKLPEATGVSLRRTQDEKNGTAIRVAPKLVLPPQSPTHSSDPYNSPVYSSRVVHSVQAPVENSSKAPESTPIYNNPPAPIYNAPAPAPIYNAPAPTPAPIYNAPAPTPAPVPQSIPVVVTPLVLPNSSVQNGTKVEVGSAMFADKFSKFSQMKQLAESVIKQNMMSAGLNEDDIRAFFAAEASATAAALSVPSTSSVNSYLPVVTEAQHETSGSSSVHSSTNGSPRNGGVVDRYATFRQLMRYNAPEDRVKERMKAENFAPDEIDAFFNAWASTPSVFEKPPQKPPLIPVTSQRKSPPLRHTPTSDGLDSPTLSKLPKPRPVSTIVKTPLRMPTNAPEGSVDSKNAAFYATLLEKHKAEKQAEEDELARLDPEERERRLQMKEAARKHDNRRSAHHTALGAHCLARSTSQSFLPGGSSLGHASGDKGGEHDSLSSTSTSTSRSPSGSGKRNSTGDPPSRKSSFGANLLRKSSNILRNLTPRTSISLGKS